MLFSEFFRAFLDGLAQMTLFHEFELVKGSLTDLVRTYKGLYLSYELFTASRAVREHNISVAVIIIIILNEVGH